MESFIGQIIMCAFNYAPHGYMPCDGRVLQTQEYAALFALLGTRYGGDGRANFVLPDLKGRIPVQSESETIINQIVTNGHGEDISVKTTEVFYYNCVEGIFPPRD